MIIMIGLFAYCFDEISSGVVLFLDGFIGQRLQTSSGEWLSIMHLQMYVKRVTVCQPGSK